MTTVLPEPTPDTAPRTATAPGDWAGVAERLMGEFEGRVGLADVSRTVRTCWQELAASGAEPDADVLEQRTREQLAAAAAEQGTGGRTQDVKDTLQSEDAVRSMDRVLGGRAWRP